MEVAENVASAFFRLQSVLDAPLARGERGCRGYAAFSVASPPPPRPPPATRFARGGRGASPCSLKCSIPRSLSHQAPPLRFSSRLRRRILRALGTRLSAGRCVLSGIPPPPPPLRTTSAPHDPPPAPPPPA